jgi:hypothetical protein
MGQITNHRPGVEVRPGVFTTNDPKFDWDHKIKRMVNSGTGKAIPDDVRAFTLLEHDMAAEAAINGYLLRLDNLGAPDGHIAAVSACYEHFQKFRQDNPKRMKLPNTTLRSPSEQGLLNLGPVPLKEINKKTARKKKTRA